MDMSKLPSRSENYDLPGDNDTRSLREQLEALCEEPGRSGESRSNESQNTTGALDFLQDFKLPSPPSTSPGSSPSASKEQDCRDASPKDTNISRDYSRAASCPMAVRQETEQSLESVNEGGPKSLPLSNASSHDSYIWSSASCELPSSLEFLEGQFIIPPLEEVFGVIDGCFDEGIHWDKSISLGEGAFGQCYMASERKKDSKTPLFCVKICGYHEDEVLALVLARKKNIAEIVEFYGATITPKENRKEACIFMEYMNGGSVANLVKCTRVGFPNQRPVIPKQYALSYLKDVLKALKFTHENGLVHNDVKGANVLLDESALHAKLADFGSATSWRYSSYSFDVWAAGCFLIEMLEGSRPTELLAVTKTRRFYSGKFPSCTAEKERMILSMCFSRNCTAEEIIRCLQT